MANSTLIRASLLFALIVAFGFAASGSAPAQDRAGPVIQLVGSDATSRFVPLGIGKSVVIDLPRDIKDVLVADPKIANAVVRSTRRAYIIGAAVGQTNVYFFDAEGRQIGGLDIAVTRDLNGLRAALKQALPGADVHVEGLGDGLVLLGSVSNAMESQTAFDIASRLVGDEKKIVNSITVHGRDQVMLKVTVAEVQREIIKQLGVNINGSLGFGSTVVNFNNTNGFPINGPLGPSSIAGTFKSVTATLRAMERAGVVRVLAEPTLTAISGESAHFLAGGKFPIPVASTGTGGVPTIAVQWEKFGVSLNFTPVVMSEGRISLKVLTEVSELSAEGSVTIQGFSIPAIRTRNVDTTLEIPSGGSLAMAGMIQEETKQQINGLPGLMQVPILGTLFKSRDYVNRQTELMVLVTPYIVRSTMRKDLSRPDDGFADPSDPAAVLLGRLNRIYGVAGNADPKRTYRGNYGFILD
jgi:pilus assembly protein CpaC